MCLICGVHGYKTELHKTRQAHHSMLRVWDVPSLDIRQLQTCIAGHVQSQSAFHAGNAGLFTEELGMRVWLANSSSSCIHCSDPVMALRHRNHGMNHENLAGRLWGHLSVR